ncbi:uncharacterized protein LOC135374632 [Ornithodoros turicata]|uniref:uncharacterized protein LOC135374632 n=1 Tax=Ornithodoros turicata TaxID=34597 RepID=UPI003139FD66
MVEWVEICYKEISAQLVVNGCLSPRFSVSRSVRQGCPLSPILFALYLEPLCRAIIDNVLISGLRAPHQEVKLVAYADDVTVICSSKEQVKVALAIVEAFCDASGARLNINKSKGAWIGDWEEKPTQYLETQWSSEVGRYLGVSLDWETADTAKWEPKINALQAKLKPYQGRKLSLISRSYVCNTVLFPVILYPAQATPIDATTVHRFERTCAVFLWQSKFERMRRTNIFWPLQEGGLGVVNLEIKIKVLRFIYFRDEARPQLRTAIQTLGTHHLLQWIVSTKGGVPNTRVLGFYREIQKSITFFCEKFSWDYLSKVKKKKLYWDTVSSSFPPPLYRRSYNETPGEHGQDVLRRVRRLPIPTSTNDFFVRFHVEVVPVQQWLLGKGFDVPRAGMCLVCGQEETLRHALFDCRSAVLFWSDLRATLELSIDFSYEELKFLFFPRARFPELVSVVDAAGLHALWKSRTVRVKCDVRALSPVAYLKSKLMWTLSLVGQNRLREEPEWKRLATVIENMDPKTFGCVIRRRYRAT